MYIIIALHMLFRYEKQVAIIQHRGYTMILHGVVDIKSYIINMYYMKKRFFILTNYKKTY